MKVLADYVRDHWRGAGDPPEVRVVEGSEAFLVTLSREFTGTVGRMVAYRDFCVRPGTSMFQIVDKLLAWFEQMQPWGPA